MNWPLVLDPAGSNASSIAMLTWVLIFVVGIVFVLVVAYLAIATFGKDSWKRVLTRHVTVITAGFAIPVMVLTVLLSYSLVLTRNLATQTGETTMRVQITGEMWWWRVDYLDRAGNITLRAANELHIPVGQTVALELVSADVIHSFWIPQLGGKKDMIPGRRNVLLLSADRTGVFAGQCAEFCGGTHALMGFTVIAHEKTDFDAWMKKHSTNPPLPSDPLAQRGADLFQSLGCAACHVVRGTAANGNAGPDLTHVGARQKLGAGILPNNRGTLAGWVADSQAIKPGNRMPSYKMMTGLELQAIAAYLEQLR
jgi:cytochrome c oxidase subunit II